MLYRRFHNHVKLTEEKKNRWDLRKNRWGVAATAPYVTLGISTDRMFTAISRTLAKSVSNAVGLNGLSKSCLLRDLIGRMEETPVMNGN